MRRYSGRKSCVERYFGLLEKLHVFLLVEAFGGNIQEFCLAGEDVVLHLHDLLLGERTIEEMRDALVGADVAHGVHLVFHQGDERRDDNRRTFHDERGQLVAK